MPTGITDEERIQFVLDSIGADKVVNDLERIQRGLSINEKKYKDLGLSAKLQNQAGIIAAAQRAKMAKEETAQMNESLKAARLMNMESNQMLIIGYALTRVFGGFFQGMIEDYKKLTTTQNSVLTNSITPLNKALINLQGSFEFLKFSIIEAASGPIEFFANALADFFDWISNLDPSTLQDIAIGIGAIGAAGAALIAGGIALKSASGIVAFLEAVKGGEYGTSLQNLATKDLPAFAEKAKTILGGALIVYGGIRMLNFLTDDSGQKITLADAFINAASIGLGAKLVWGERAGAWAFWASVGFEVIKQPSLFVDLLKQFNDVLYQIVVLWDATVNYIHDHSPFNKTDRSSLSFLDEIKQSAESFQPAKESITTYLQDMQNAMDGVDGKAKVLGSSIQMLSDTTDNRLDPSFRTLYNTLSVTSDKAFPDYHNAVDVTITKNSQLASSYDRLTDAIKRMNEAKGGGSGSSSASNPYRNDAGNAAWSPQLPSYNPGNNNRLGY